MGMFRNDPVTAIARTGAAAIVLVMVYYFATSDAIRADNPFLVPDAVLTVLLAVTSLLPRPIALPGMAFGFAWSAAVFTVSLFTYVVRGELPATHIVLITCCLALAILLLRRLSRPPRVRRP
ncbi:MAG TPA: hypothetical protein VF062_00325 [Candidatus Limnocylindrales bacterium]